MKPFLGDRPSGLRPTPEFVASFVVAAVLETLAANAPYDEDGGFELWHPPALRGLAAAIREGR